MARDRNVIAIRFDDDAKTYRALAQLKKADADGLVDVHAAVVIERKADGRIEVADGADNLLGAGVTTGSVIGLLVGLLGGPFGMLLGWGAGALIGGAIDANKASDTDAAIGEFARTVPPGQNALVADVSEAREDIIDGVVAADGGTVARRPVDEVLDEVVAAAEAAKDAQEAAAVRLREHKRAERSEEFHQRWERIKDKVHL